jgi:hypothetical protein
MHGERIKIIKIKRIDLFTCCLTVHPLMMITMMIICLFPYIACSNGDTSTGTLLKIFPFLARDSLLTIPNKIILYKQLLCSMITYVAPVWSSTSPTNYRHLQVYQSKCLRDVGDFPRRTPILNLHAHLQIIPIHQFIYHLTDKFFVNCPMKPNPLIRNTGNYTLEDLHRQCTKYRHKHIKHILL